MPTQRASEIIEHKYNRIVELIEILTDFSMV